MVNEMYSHIINRLLEECRKHYGSRLVTFCVFGSAGRGTVHPGSDIDFLIVVDSLPDGRRRRIEDYMRVEAALKEEVAKARAVGIFIEFSPVIKTPDEVLQGSPLFLDMIDDGKILFDRDDFFRQYLVRFSEKLRSQGARRVYRGDSWYWILKEPYVVGEEIEL